MHIHHILAQVMYIKSQWLKLELKAVLLHITGDAGLALSAVWKVNDCGRVHPSGHSSVDSWTTDARYWIIEWRQYYKPRALDINVSRFVLSGW